MSTVNDFIRPSALGTIIHCPYAPTARLLYPKLDNHDTEAAEYGTAAHWVSEQQANSVVVNEGDVAPNGIVIDWDILHGVREYVLMIEQLRQVCKQYNWVEIPLTMDRLFPGLKGTADFAAYDPATGTLYILDLKFGFRIVEPYENYQLIAYVEGMLEMLGFTGLDEQKITVKMIIHQPRAWHPESRTRSWVVRADELRGYCNRITNSCHAAARPNPTARTGDHCKYCPALHACEAARRAGLNAIDYVNERNFAVELDDFYLESEYVALEQAARAIENRKNALEAILTEKIKQGAYFSKVKIKQGSARRKWAKSDDEIIQMGKVLSIPLFDEKVVTPAEAERRGVDLTQLGSFVSKGLTAPKLKVQKTKTIGQRVFGNE